MNINPKSGERLKQVRLEQGISQEALAGLINYTSPYISLVESSRRALSADMASAIVAVFPEYRIRWLLGDDDFKTEQEREKDEYKRWRLSEEERVKILNAIITIANGTGWNIKKTSEDGLSIKSKYDSDPFNATTKLSSVQKEMLINEISELVSMRLNWLNNLTFATILDDMESRCFDDPQEQ